MAPEGILSMIIGRRDTASGVSILDLKGNLTIVDGAAPLREAVQELIGEGCTKVVLNLRNLSHIDSSGIGSIVAVYSQLAQHHGELKLLGVDPKLATLLSAVECFDNELEAIRSFRTTGD